MRRWRSGAGSAALLRREIQTDDEAAPFYAALGYEPESGVWVLSRSYTL